MSEKKNNRKTINSLKLFQDIIIKNDDDISEEPINKKKEMISYKNLQNLDLTTYDYIFLDRQLCNTTIQDFSSFNELIKEIKNKYKPDLLNSHNIQKIKSEGKFSLNKYNITKLICFHDKKVKNLEMSINSKYILTNDIKFQNVHFFASKSIFKGKHCFEIEILKSNTSSIFFGLLNINCFEIFKKEYCKSKNNEFNLKSNYNLLNNFEQFKLESPIFINKNNNIYHHYISYGDIFGLCFDLSKKLLYLYLNGEIINTYILNLEINQNISFVPVISLGKYTEILFNPGENLKYAENYKKIGFIPLDKNDKNNYEISQLMNITNEYLNILINNGKSIINNKNITYSDINQIYHNIFDFLGNISFQHSYIIHNCLINNILIKNDNNNDDLELYYICIKYILNSVKDQKTLLKNIILNLIESIHLNLKLGNIQFKKSFELLVYLFSKKDIINIISQFPKNIIKCVFSEIFISLNFQEDIFNKINLDFIIKQESSSNKKQEDKDKIFKDLVTNFDTFSNYLISSQDEYYKLNIHETFSKLVKILLINGIESKENENMLNNNIIKYLNEFLVKKKEEICKTLILEKSYNDISEILKTFFIPGMHLFNIEYNKGKKEENNKISFSIKNYINDIENEKLGGTMKTLNEQYIKEMNDFEEIRNMKINNYNNVFLNMFIDFFLKGSNYLWDNINGLITKYEYYSKDKFINCINKESSEVIYYKFKNFIDYKLYYPNLEEITIFVTFLNNFLSFFLDELYPKKLIYFIPEFLVYGFGRIITFLKNILLKISFKSEILDYYLSLNNNNNTYKAYFTEIETRKKNLESLCKKGLKQYITFLVKIISDKNIKKVSFKSDIFNNLQNLIRNEEYFTDQELFHIFDFASEIHNNPDYLIIIHEFMKIFENKIIKNNNNGQIVFNSLGNRLYNLCKTKENTNILRIVLILLYNYINSGLSKLEESFAEYKFKPRTNTRNNIPNLNDNNNNDNNNGDNNINEENNEDNIQDDNFGNFLGMQLFNQLMQMQGLNRQRENRIIIVRNIIPRRNIEQLSDTEKLRILHDSLKRINSQFNKLIIFYQLSHDIKELYDFNSFENKYLNNLLVSLYNIVFSPNNINKISDNNVINSYNKLLGSILRFYNIIFNNMNKLNDENILKEISKRRNLYHLKEIGECFNKLNESKKEENKSKIINVNNLIKINNDINDAKLYNDFVLNLEKIIPEEQVIKLININTTAEKSELNIDEKNICSICADSTIDTHIIPCEHAICRNCFYQCLSGNKACPFCRVLIQGIKEDKNFKI